MKLDLIFSVIFIIVVYMMKYFNNVTCMFLLSLMKAGDLPTKTTFFFFFINATFGLQNYVLTLVLVSWKEKRMKIFRSQNILLTNKYE